MPVAMFRNVVVAVVVIAGSTIAALPAAAQNVKAHKAAAERAIVKERWCEAVFLYAELDKVDANPEWALQAADAAQFADDRAKALSLYKSALARAPKHPRARAMEASIAALEKLIEKSGNGTACTAPRAECGNGVIESGETCDDGNVQSGDTCPATCTGGKPVPVTPTKTTPTPPPVVTPPPPPVVTPPPPPVTTPPPSSSGGGNELCTLQKPLKMFSKGEWKNLEFGATINIKSRGPQWTMVETTSGDGKIASSTMDGACSSATSPVKTESTPVKTESTPPPPPPPPPPPTDTTPPPPPPTDTHVDDHVSDPHANDHVSDPHANDHRDDHANDRRDDRHDIAPLEREHGDHEPGGEKAEPKKGGGGLGGWITLGVGTALAAGGTAAGVWGALPYFDYVRLCRGSFGSTQCPELANDGKLATDYTKKSSDQDRAKVADDARDLRLKVNNAADAWDGTGGNGTGIPTGRVVFAVGSGVGGVGVALMVTGLIWGIAGGGSAEPTEEDEHDGGRR